MAATVDTSKLLSSLKAKAKGSWKEARSVEATAKGQVLPGGIIKGVAAITGTKFAADKNKAPYFLLKAVVISPEDFTGTQFTKLYSMSEPKSDKANSVAVKLEKFSSDIQLLGVVTEGTELDDLPKLWAALGLSKTCFYFNTWMPPKNEDGSEPSTYIFIQGVAKDAAYPDVVETEAEAEGEAEPEPEPEAAASPKAKGPKAKGPKAKGPAAAPEPEPEPEAEAEDWTPQVEEQYALRCTDGKPDKEGEPEPVEIMEVDEAAKTVKVKIESTGKLWKGIAWTRLEGDE